MEITGHVGADPPLMQGCSGLVLLVATAPPAADPLFIFELDDSEEPGASLSSGGVGGSRTRNCLGSIDGWT